MGDPKTPRRVWKKPKRPLNYDLMMDELKTLGTFGLKTKRELWKTQTELSRVRFQARSLLALRQEERERKEPILMQSLSKIGLVDENSTLDDVLNLQITDLTELRRENESMDYLKFTRRMIQHFKQERGEQFSVFILDSLGAIYSLTKVDEEMRKKMFGFFDFLRNQGLYTFIITERHSGEFAELQGNEGFIADGIINLGLDRRNGKIVRTMQVEKMRHIRHSMEKQAIDISPSGVTVLGPLFD